VIRHAKRPGSVLRTEAQRRREERDDRGPADYALLEDRRVYLPDDALPASESDACVACGDPPTEHRRIQPGPYSMFFTPKGKVRSFRLPFCLRCSRGQKRRGQFPWAATARFWIALGAFPLILSIQSGRSAPIVTSIYAANLVLLAALYRWDNAPVYVVHRRHRSELEFRFRCPSAARRFAVDNGWEGDA